MMNTNYICAILPFNLNVCITVWKFKTNVKGHIVYVSLFKQGNMRILF